MMRRLHQHGHLGTAPEQNFLSQYFKWQESLHWKYNFQLHQLIFTANQHSGNTASRMHIDFEEVAVFHYSTEWKPSRLLKTRSSVGEGSDDFMGVFFKKFMCEHDEVRDFITKAFELWWTTYEHMSKHLLEHITDLLERGKSTRGALARWRQILIGTVDAEAEAELDEDMHQRSGSAPSSGSLSGHKPNAPRVPARSRSRSIEASKKLLVGGKFEVGPDSWHPRSKRQDQQPRF